MKKILFGTLSLFLLGCESKKACYRENCFISRDVVITEDMRRIANIILNYYKEYWRTRNEGNLKIVKIACELFGKDNRKLNKELDKIREFHDEKETKRLKKLLDDLEKSLKGLRLDYKQVLPLIREMEKAYAEIMADSRKKYLPYMERAREILKSIKSKDDAKEEWTYSYYEDGIQSHNYWEIYSQIHSITEDDYNRFSTYDSLTSMLFGFIDRGILVDSFLESHQSPLNHRDERAFTSHISPSIYGIVPTKNEDGIVVFDVVKGAIEREKIDKNELRKIVGSIANYMTSLASSIVDIQHDVTDKIDHESHLEQYREEKFNNFYAHSRYSAITLTEKYPKLVDFEREVDKVAVRLAYQTYFRANAARFLYKEWHDTYLTQINEFWRNSAILAERLHKMCQNENISDDSPDKLRYEHESSLRNIAAIKEMTKIGIKKIFSIPDCYIDSQKEIRESYRARILKMREVYLKR
ncbi:MAG: hypothetical protein LBF54_02245 [Holosporaceae bacterium]|nr:hypothetical protein [Holosporaceae bacterium]